MPLEIPRSRRGRGSDDVDRRPGARTDAGRWGEPWLTTCGCTPTPGPTHTLGRHGDGAGVQGALRRDPRAMGRPRARLRAGTGPRPPGRSSGWGGLRVVRDRRGSRTSTSTTAWSSRRWDGGSAGSSHGGSWNWAAEHRPDLPVRAAVDSGERRVPRDRPRCGSRRGGPGGHPALPRGRARRHPPTAAGRRGRPRRADPEDEFVDLWRQVNDAGERWASLPGAPVARVRASVREACRARARGQVAARRAARARRHAARLRLLGAPGAAPSPTSPGSSGS